MTKADWQKRSIERGRSEPTWKRYGIKNASMKRYKELLVAQNGVCAICSEPPTYRKLALDHSHKTGEIRGLLCIRCNYNIGTLEKWLDNPEWLERGKTYLSRCTDSNSSDASNLSHNVKRPIVTERRLEIGKRAINLLTSTKKSLLEVIDEVAAEEGYCSGTIRRYIQQIDPELYRSVKHRKLSY